jgi:hypothetical protein
MKPYARRSTRLAKARELENAAWLDQQGHDRRATGQLAHERMAAIETQAREGVIEFLKAGFDDYMKRREKKQQTRRGRPYVPPPAIHRKVLGNG